MPVITSQTWSRFRTQRLPEKGTWIYLRSEGIDAIRFILTDPSSGTGTLRISFIRKTSANPKKPQTNLTSIYDYYKVPESLYLELIASPTPMRLVISAIKNKFDFKRLSDEDVKREDTAAAVQKLVIDDQFLPDVELPSDILDDSISLDSSAEPQRIVTSQAINRRSPSDNLLIALANNNTFNAPYSYYYGELELSISPTATAANPSDEGYNVSINRRSMLSDGEPYSQSKRYARRKTATNAMQNALDRYERVNTIPNVANEQEFLQSNKLVKGEFEYFISRGGDNLFHIERRPVSENHGPEDNDQSFGVNSDNLALVRNFAFTSYSDAVGQLCGNPIFDTKVTGNDIFPSPRSKDPSTTSKDPYDFDINLIDDIDLPNPELF